VGTSQPGSPAKKPLKWRRKFQITRNMTKACALSLSTNRPIASPVGTERPGNGGFTGFGKSDDMLQLLTIRTQLNTVQKTYKNNLQRFVMCRTVTYSL